MTGAHFEAAVGALVRAGFERDRLSVLASHESLAVADAKAAADNAAVLEVVHKLPWTAFGADTQSGDTKAKAEIWKEPAKFKEAEEKLFAEMPKIVAAARGGKQDELRAAFAAGGGVCKNCHDNFRQ